MTQGQLVVVLVVEDVHQVGVERVDVVQLRETVHDRCQLLVHRLLHELHLAHVEFPDTRDLEVLMDLSRRLSLRLGQRNVDQLVRLGDLSDLLKVIAHGIRYI